MAHPLSPLSFSTVKTGVVVATQERIYPWFDKRNWINSTREAETMEWTQVQSLVGCILTGTGQNYKEDPSSSLVGNDHIIINKLWNWHTFKPGSSMIIISYGIDPCFKPGFSCSYLGPRKKCCVALSALPISKNKISKIWVGNAPNFCQVGCFFTFFEEKKKLENAHKFCTLGCFIKNLFKKKNHFLTNRPKYSEIPLEGNTTIFFFWPYIT